MSTTPSAGVPRDEDPAEGQRAVPQWMRHPHWAGFTRPGRDLEGAAGHWRHQAVVWTLAAFRIPVALLAFAALALLPGLILALSGFSLFVLMGGFSLFVAAMAVIAAAAAWAGSRRTLEAWRQGGPRAVSAARGFAAATTAVAGVFLFLFIDLELGGIGVWRFGGPEPGILWIFGLALPCLAAAAGLTTVGGLLLLLLPSRRRPPPDHGAGRGRGAPPRSSTARPAVEAPTALRPGATAMGCTVLVLALAHFLSRTIGYLHGVGADWGLSIEARSAIGALGGSQVLLLAALGTALVLWPRMGPWERTGALVILATPLLTPLSGMLPPLHGAWTARPGPWAGVPVLAGTAFLGIGAWRTGSLPRPAALALMASALLRAVPLLLAGSGIRMGPLAGIPVGAGYYAAVLAAVGWAVAGAWLVQAGRVQAAGAPGTAPRPARDGDGPAASAPWARPLGILAAVAAAAAAWTVPLGWAHMGLGPFFGRLLQDTQFSFQALVACAAACSALALWPRFGRLERVGVLLVAAQPLYFSLVYRLDLLVGASPTRQADLDLPGAPVGLYAMAWLAGTFLVALGFTRARRLAPGYGAVVGLMWGALGVGALQVMVTAGATDGTALFLFGWSGGLMAAAAWFLLGRLVSRQGMSGEAGPVVRRAPAGQAPG